MLFLMFVIILLIGIIGTYLSVEHWRDDWSDIVGPFSVSAILIFGVAIIVSLFIMADENACKEANYSAYMATYESLTYQYENDLYDNDNDYGKKELMNDILDYNKEIVKKRALNDSAWLGIYYSDIYDDLPLIELTNNQNES